MSYHGAVRISDGSHAFYISAVDPYRHPPVKSDIQKVIEAMRREEGSGYWCIAWFTQVFLTGKSSGVSIGLETDYSLWTDFFGYEDRLYFVKKTVFGEWNTFVFAGNDKEMRPPYEFNESDIAALERFKRLRAGIIWQ